MDILYFAKCNEKAVIPTKRDEDAGFDIYPCFDENYIAIRPHETVLIPTGLCSAFSSDYVMILKERGSTGTKGIGQRCGVVDSGYRGEIKVPITNHNDVMLFIGDVPNALTGGVIVYPKTKAICQALMLQVPKIAIKEISNGELQAISSERGDGAWGSSGK